MNLNETNCLNLFTSASNKTSRIPRFLSNIVCDIRVNDSTYQTTNNYKFWKKYLNLNSKHSRIPVFKSKYNNFTQNSLQTDQNSGPNDYTIKQIETNLLIKNYTNFNDFKIILKTKLGLSLTTDGDWTQSEPIDCLKFMIEIIRRDISIENKFKAIKQFRDHRLGNVGENMDKFSDERVREWVDSGYISNSTSVGQNDDVFKPNEPIDTSKCESPVGATNPVQISPRIAKELATFQRRSLNNKRAMDLIAMNSKYNSFNSEVSMSSISSIESLLESRREDPEELLLALGFGYPTDDQSLNRIPQRFLESPSYAKGVNPSDNICNTYGIKDIPTYSPSVSFPTTDIRERSYSSGRISDRFIKKRFSSSKESVKNTDLPEIITHSCGSLPQTDSILNPANRMFLENQGKEDNSHQLSSRRLIIGTKSYKLDTDGDPLAFPRTPSPSPSPVNITPVPADTDMEVSQTAITDEQNLVHNKDNNFSHMFKRNSFQLQNGVLFQDLAFNESNGRSSMNDMSSELSSSTTTLIGTAMSGTNEFPIDYSSDNSDNKCNAGPQIDQNLRQFNSNRAVEAALVVAIQSLRLSLEFYRHQSLKVAKISAQKFNESTNLAEEDLESLSKINELRECIHKEIVEMDIVLNRHLQLIHKCDVVDISFISQAQVFTEAVKKVKQLLTEQQNLYSRLGFINNCDNC